MKPPVLATLIALALPCGLAAQETAAPMRVDVRVFQFHKGSEWPVRSDVTLLATGETKRTARDGTTFFELAKCDESVELQADPVMSYLDIAKSSCEGPPVPLEVKRLYTGAFFDLFDNPDGLDAGLADNPRIARALDETGNRDRLDTLYAAYETGDLATVAALANELSWSLRNAAPGAAQSLSVIAMDTGYRAIGIDPASESAPLIAYDPVQDLHVMTPLGRDVIARFSDAAEIGSEAIWASDTFEAIRAETASQPRRPILVPESELDIRNLQFYRDGRFLNMRIP